MKISYSCFSLILTALLFLFGCEHSDQRRAAGNETREIAEAESDDYDYDDELEDENEQAAHQIAKERRKLAKEKEREAEKQRL